MKKIQTHRYVQAHLRDTAGSVPDYHNKVSITIKQVVNFFATGESCLHFVNNAISAEHSKAKCNKMRYVCSWNGEYITFSNSYEYYSDFTSKLNKW